MIKIIKIGLISLGCAKNRVDAEIMLATLKSAGYKLVNNVAEADVVIVNTCGFIEDAKTESIEEILDVARLKYKNKVKAIVVTGCLAERYKEQIANELTEVDAVVGLGSNKDIVSVVEDVLKGKKVERYGPKKALPLTGERVQTTPQYSAYLKIADGCDNCCTYCAIPLIRGKFRSRPIEDVIEEAERLVRRGVKELLVIAQDTTRYGEDLYGRLVLPELLKKLCEIENLKWVRVLYCYPDRVTDSLLEVIASENKIVKYLDLPLQHCNGRILKVMNRRGDKEQLEKLIQKIRVKVPGIVIRTSIIAGFPSESPEEFEELTQFCKNVKFERMGCFTYSQEEDTPAALLENQIDKDVKTRRQEILMEDQMKVMEEFANTMVGKELEVLVEGRDKKENVYFGRSYADAPDVDCKVFFRSDNHKIKEGDITTVKITSTIECDLVGENLSEA